MDRTNLSHNTNKIKIGILIITIISYGCFLISHFLVWGFTKCMGSLHAFIGLDSPSAIISTVLLNGLFVIGFINYTGFHFNKQMRKDYLMHWVLNNIIIVACVAAFINVLIEVYVGWEVCSLDHVVFGFYIWLVSVIVIIGGLGYLNVIFQRIHELKNLYVKVNIPSPFTSTEILRNPKNI